MTPAQRKYDQDLAASMRHLALRIAGRSRKISDTLKVAADRIEALSAGVPVEPQPQDEQQPASTSDQAQGLNR